MLNKTPSIKQQIHVAGILFLFCFSIFTVLISIRTTDQISLQPSPAPLLNPIDTSYNIQTNITKIGQGNNLNYYEIAWGTKIQRNLNQSSWITWETPESWNCPLLSVSITDLKEPLSGKLNLLANSHIVRRGTEQSSWTFTSLLDNSMYNTTGSGSIPTGELNFTLFFHTDVVRSTVSQIYITSYGFSSINQLVSYYIHNFTSRGNDYKANIPQGSSSIGWVNTSIISGISDYVSPSGDIWIQFRAPSGLLNPAQNYLDFIQVEITATHEWVNPEDVGLWLKDGSTYYPITGALGSGSVSISGNWTENPHYFYFGDLGTDVIFNATSSFWAYQNKIGSVTSAYYVNLSRPTPATHQWRLQFSQDSYPSGNFTNLNFSVSVIPYDWILVNSTNPGGSLRTLDEKNVVGGKSIEADSGDITGNGTWSIYYKSPNYITSVQLRKNSLLLPPNPKLKIWDTLDIQANFSRRIVNGRVNLTVSFENKVNNSNYTSGILGLMTIFTWTISSTANKNGTYLITISFFNQTEIGIYSCFINVYFPTAMFILAPEIASIEFKKGDPLNVTAFFENLFYPGNYYNEKGIANANMRWIISNSSYSESGNLTQRFGGYYNSTINTSSLKVTDGSYNLTITANKVGYENQSNYISLRCFAMIHPTKAAIIIPPAAKNIKLISGMNYSCWVYPNQSLTIQINYTDIFKSPFLIDYGFSRSFLYTSIGTLLSSYSSVGIRSSPYLYKINISNVNLPIGHYTLLINMSKKYYINSSIWVNFTISPLEPTIKVSKLYSSQNITAPYIEWENLTLSFKVEYRTTKYYQFSSWNTPVNWGLVRYFIVFYGKSILIPNNILKTGVIPINGTGIFEVRNLHLSNASGAFQPGIYQVYIACNATECQERSFNFNVTILEKVSTTITISRFPEKFSVDQQISLEATLISSVEAVQSYLNQKIVFFNFTVFYNSGNTSTFQIPDAVNQYGVAELSFYLGNYIFEDLDDVAYLEISVYFKGFIANYPTYSFYPTAFSKVTSSVSAAFDISFIIYIILGVVGGIAAVFVVQRKILVPKQLKQTKNITYLFRSFKDVVSLQNLFVILKSTGSCLLCKTYSPEGIAESMEAVLCKVIANYAKGDRRHDAFCDLIRFENNKILLDDGDFVRVAVTIGATPSEKLIRSLVRFVQYFELQNYSLLKNATGPVEGLQGVDELLDIQFGASLIAPYTLAHAKKLSGFEETVQLMAANLLGEHDYFYLSQLYARAKGETLVDEVMIFKTIQDLVDKRVIVPYDATKKTDGAPKLAILDFDRLKANIVSIKNKALKAVTAKRFEDATDYYREAASLATSIGDLEAKEQFLKKAGECSARVISFETSSEEYSEEISEEATDGVSGTVPEEIPEPSPEQISEPIPLRKEFEKVPPPPSKPIQPSYLEGVRKKSKDLLEVEEPSTSEVSFAESLLQDTDELTPFERELAKHEELSLKAADLMTEEPPPPVPEKTIPIPESVPPKAKGSSIEDAFEILEQTKPVKEELPEKRPIREEVKPIVQKERPTVKEELKPLVKEELPLIKEEVSLVREEKPIISLSAKELKEINNYISDTAKVLQDSTKKLTELNNLSKKLSLQKDKIKEEAKQTHNSIMEKVKSHTQHLLIPRKDVKEEIEITKTDIPDIIKEIDRVDSEVVKIKKQISESTKDCKKLREGLEQANSKMTTFEKYFSNIPPAETTQEKKQLASLTKSYTEAIGTLDAVEKQVSSLNQEIVTLMIEDIEKMMAQEQNLEKILNETYQKLKDTNKVQEAFLKENKKLNEDLEALDRVVSLGETIFNDTLIQKAPLVSNIEWFETEFQNKIQVMHLTIDDRTKDLGFIFSDLQVLENGIDQLNQSVRVFQDKIEKNTRDLGRFPEIISKIDQRKKNISTVIEKTTKFIFPNIILKQRGFLTDFDEKLQTLYRKSSELNQNLNAEKNYISQGLSSKLTNLTNILQEIESKASTALRISPEVQPTRILPETASLLRTAPAEKESTLFPELEEEEREKTKAIAPPPKEDTAITDKKLGLKQHCPYCKHIIPENVMNLLRKGFEPECPNCGEVITPSKIHLD